MWQISFVLHNQWYTLVGDNQSIVALEDLLRDSPEVKEKQLINVSKVGMR